MTEYICHKDFSGKCIAGDVNLKRGTKAEMDSSTIFVKDLGIICLGTSYIANRHFAINEDGEGLKRGDLTYAIAYANRDGGNGFRFSDDEQVMFLKEYPQFLKSTDGILFNHSFFTADIPILEEIADRLNIHIGEE